MEAQRVARRGGHRLVDAGRMDPRVATALASLASATVKVYEVASLEQRLLALEEQNARVG